MVDIFRAGAVRIFSSLCFPKNRESPLRLGFPGREGRLPQVVQDDGLVAQSRERHFFLLEDQHAHGFGVLFH